MAVLIHYVDQAGFELREICLPLPLSVSASQGMGFKVCTITPDQLVVLFG